MPSANWTTSFPLRHTECAYYYKRRARVPVLHVTASAGPVGDDGEVVGFAGEIAVVLHHSR